MRIVRPPQLRSPKKFRKTRKLNAISDYFFRLGVKQFPLVIISIQETTALT